MLKTAALIFAIPLGVFLLMRPAAGSDAMPSCGASNALVVGSTWLACASSSSIGAALPEAAASSGPALGSHGDTTATPAAAAAPQFCTYSSTDPLDGTAAPALREGGGRWVFVYCGDSGQAGGWTWVAAGKGALALPSPAQLARQAWARLVPKVDVPQYNPHRRDGAGGGTVVGFDTWLWLGGGGMAERSASASAGTNSATVTAQVASVSFDPGDGSPPLICAGGGVPYDPARPDAVSDCVHRYLHPSATAAGGAFVLTVRVVWSASWTGTGGTGGTLPPLTVAAQTPIRVVELQAVNG